MSRVPGWRIANGVRLYLNGIEERSTKPKVESSSLSGRTLEADFLVGMVMVQTRHVATPIDWFFAPDWLTIRQACELSGWDPKSLQEIIDDGGVDVDDVGHCPRADGNATAADHVADFYYVSLFIRHHIPTESNVF